MGTSRRYRMLFTAEKNISNFAEATREKRFTTMTPLGMSRDVTCHRLWRHNCFSNSIQFKLIYFISKWTLPQNLLKNPYFSLYQKKKQTFWSPLVQQIFHNVLTNTTNSSLNDLSLDLGSILENQCIYIWRTYTGKKQAQFHNRNNLWTNILKYEKHMHLKQFSCFCDLDHDLLGVLGIGVVRTETNIYIWSWSHIMLTQI